jgi:hypothetical protein
MEQRLGITMWIQLEKAEDLSHDSSDPKGKVSQLTALQIHQASSQLSPRTACAQ